MRVRRLFAVSLALVAVSGCWDSGNSGPPPLTITASSPPAGTTGVAYPGYVFTASGGNPPLSWTEGGTLPPGLSLNASGQLSGNPATAGTYAIVIKVTDSSVPPQVVNAPVSISVSDSPIVVAPASPPAGTVTYAYPGFTFSASGGSPPYTWTASGTVPPGLTVGSDGTVSGTPTQVGTFSFSVTATDSAQTPASSAPPAPAQIVINVPTALTLNTSPAPPAGVDGSAYGPFSFSATGGYLPLKWSITAGSLPPGLTLGNGGSVSGTPASVGTFMFTVTVTDSAPVPVSQSAQFGITVTLPPPPVINNQEAPTGTVGMTYAPYTYTAINGVPPLTWSEAPPLVMGLTLSSQGVLAGTPTAAGQFAITLNVMDAVNRPAPAFPTIVRVSLARPPASFTATGSMKLARSGHAATLLLSGLVLVSGGGGGVADPTAELYDPSTGTFASTTGNMTEARIGHTATLLNLSNTSAPNYGRVLIVGSTDTTAELYDPAASTFAATGSMHHPRTSPTATLLNTGKVLIVGGNTTSGDLVAELYDPTAMTFSDTASTTASRSGHTATLLTDGRVLVAGGGSATAEIYDPATGAFTVTAGTMTEARSGHTATLLGAADGAQDGFVLILGPDNSAELYDPGTQLFARVGYLPPGLEFAGRRNTVSLRNDGTVVAAGGSSPRLCLGVTPFSVFGAALFAPESNGFTASGSLNTPRDTHTATVLKDGTVLIVGGTQHFNQRVFNGCFHRAVVQSTAELFR